MGDLYRELIKVNITPAQADELELWQISALMLRSARDIAADPEEMNRLIIEARYRAAAEGRELDPDEVFTGMSDADISKIAPTRMVAPPSAGT